MIIAFDTETTGKIEFKVPSEDPSHPHLCSIAWITCNDQGENEGEQIHYIKPDGWTVPDDVLPIHGLTTEFLTENGKPLADVVELFFSDIEKAEYRVAYNHGYDNRMIRIEQHRLGASEPMLAWWKNGPSKCAMAPMVSRCKLPATAEMRKYPGLRYRHKQPTLAESYTHLFGAPHDDAHGALGDARAALAIWRFLLAEGVPAL